MNSKDLKSLAEAYVKEAKLDPQETEEAYDFSKQTQINTKAYQKAIGKAIGMKNKLTGNHCIRQVRVSKKHSIPLVRKTKILTMMVRRTELDKNRRKAEESSESGSQEIQEKTESVVLVSQLPSLPRSARMHTKSLRSLKKHQET